MKTEETDDESTASNKFMQILSESDLTVNWELAELHKLPTYLTRPVDQEAREQIDRRGIPFKAGHFNSDEDKIIAKNWKSLCKKYELQPDPRALAAWRNNKRSRKMGAARRFAVLWLAKGLPNRTPTQVYNRFLHTLGCSTKGRYTESELSIIESFVSANNAQTQQHLASILGRDEPSIYRRIKLIRGKNFDPDKFKRLKWTLELDKMFLKKVLFVLNGKDVTLTEANVEILRSRKITWEEWTKVGQETNIPPLKLKVHWNGKLYVQIFSPRSIYLSQILAKILSILKKERYMHWVEVDWEAVSKNFEFLTPIFLWQKFYFFALRFCKSKIKSFRAVADHLNEKFIIEKHDIPKLRLQRIAIIENEELQYFK